MPNLLEALLESWDRNNTILTNLVKSLPEESLQLKPSPTSWPVAVHLSHIHEVRLFWLGQTAPEFAQGVEQLFAKGEPWSLEREPQRDLSKIVAGLNQSRKAVGDAVKTYIEADKPMTGPYSHPVHFLQHMLWHEAYHFGQLMLALKTINHATSEAWQEENIWGVWRS